MRLSTRNQLAGEIVSIARGEAMATIKVRLTGTEQVCSRRPSPLTRPTTSGSSRAARSPC